MDTRYWWRLVCACWGSDAPGARVYAAIGAVLVGLTFAATIILLAFALVDSGAVRP